MTASNVRCASCGRFTRQPLLRVDALLSDEAVEAVALIIRNGHPHDGSDCDDAVDMDAYRMLKAAVAVASSEKEH